MNKSKKIIAGILIILVFLCVFIPKSDASFFTDNSKEDTSITDAINSEDGGIFEKIIAKMIGGLAQTVFDLTTSKELNVGFKNYDELIFAKDSNFLSPFTDEQWNMMIQWYKVMTGIAGSLISIAVVVVAYKFIAGGFNIEKRNEAKDSIMRLFFGVVSIGLAPIFVKFLLFINYNLVHMIIGYSSGSLDTLLGNNVISNIKTGNAIATAIVIAMFAYLFFKLNVKFIIRQFTILIFTLFTPIVAIMWMINRRTVGASIWFGQILINVFMQFIYAFLFLIYMTFLPNSGGWAISLLWAMMILPLGDALQNTLQNLVSRVAGVNNEELANRGIGMAGAMAHSVNAIAYQFRNPNNNTAYSNKLNESISTPTFLSKVFKRVGSDKKEEPSSISKMQTTPMNVSKMETNSINKEQPLQKNDSLINNTRNVMNKSSSNIGSKVMNTGKEFLNMGMYMAEGRNFSNNRMYNRHNINNTRKEDFRKRDTENNVIANVEEKK